MQGLLDHPHYTRPETVLGQSVPAVLLSGDHERIARWREKQALGRTFERRPDLLDRKELNDAQRKLLEDYKQETGLTAESLPGASLKVEDDEQTD
jgi:tRNA (guanine37-N1)-methyltransferase